MEGPHKPHANPNCPIGNWQDEEHDVVPETSVRVASPAKEAEI